MYSSNRSGVKPRCDETNFSRHRPISTRTVECDLRHSVSKTYEEAVSLEVGQLSSSADTYVDIDTVINLDYLAKQIYPLKQVGELPHVADAMQQ